MMMMMHVFIFCCFLVAVKINKNFVPEMIMCDHSERTNVFLRKIATFAYDRNTGCTLVITKLVEESQILMDGMMLFPDHVESVGGT